MKNKFFSLALIVFLSSTSLFASNYYWVGGTGTWSDYATHWATSSGGTVFHVTIPSPSDDVFFDSNSFPAAGDTLYMDTTITNCRTMDWTGVNNTPTFYGIQINLILYGSFILSPGINWKASGGLTFLSNTQEVFNTAGVVMSPSLNGIDLSFSGNGTWDLLSDLDMGGAASYSNIALSNVTFYSHGHNIHAGDIWMSAASDIYLDNSFINCASWDASQLTGILDADSAVFQTGSFVGGNGFIYSDVTCYSITQTGNCVFRDVVFSFGITTSGNNIFRNATSVAGYSINQISGGSGDVYNKLTLSAQSVSVGGISCDTLIFNNPGQSIALSTGDTIQINSLLIADGSCGGLTSMRTSSGTAVLNVPAGTVTMNYMLLENLTGAGGATFIANNSINAGNVNGITVNSPAPQNLYWVGGTGYWDDVSHWATSSGGAGGNCVPNAFDNVFFDINSFPTANDTLYCINSQIMNCKTMDWTGVTNAPTFFGSNIGIEINGSFILSPGIIWKVSGGLNFLSNAQEVFNTAGVVMSPSLNGIYLSFRGDGATWDLLSDLDMGAAASYSDITLSNVTFFSHGHSIHAGNIWMSAASTIYLDNSSINCASWDAGQLTGILDADSAVFQTGSFVGGNGFIYSDVTCYSITQTGNCVFRDVVFNFGITTNGNNIFRNATSVAGYFINQISGGSGDVYNKLTLSAQSVSVGGITCDTLIFNNPGQSIALSTNDTIQINSLLLADGSCGGLTSMRASSGTAVLNVPAGTVTMNYMLLENLTGAGGATFIANNSINAGNVNGITVNSPAPQNLYWVGGTGYWDDVSHWALSSGGAGGNCIPNAFDNVFFDINSFPTANDTLYCINSPIMTCKTMDWTGVTNAPTFYGSNIGIEINGSFILSPGMNWKVSGGLNFLSNAQEVFNTAGVVMSPSLNGIDLSFWGNGATWDLLSDLDMGAAAYFSDIAISNVTFYSHGHNIHAGDISISAASAVYLENSSINCASWNVDQLTGILDADSAFFQAATSFYGGDGHIYNDVNCFHINQTNNCVFHDVVFNSGIVASNFNTFHNVSSAYGILQTGINGTGNTFNKLTLSGSMVSFSGVYGINTCDTLIFNNPGQQISMNSGDTITVVHLLLIQSDPGFPTSIQTSIGNGTIIVQNDSVCTDFIYLKNIIATGGAIFFAGDHSVDLGGNSGWNWVPCAPLISNVWPGDCNYDLITDNFDLLNIGVAYGDTGYVRLGASLSYTAQPCQDWYYQFINAVNVKHADCDGNGIVDAPDSSAISLNYGLTHPARLAQQDESNTVGTELAFVLPPVIIPGTNVSVPITLGTNVIPANGVYGIAFTVNYDPAFIQPGTMSVSYSGSWVENTSNHLNLEKDFPGAGKTDIAFTRIDHIDISGYGMIATLNFVASPTASGPFSLNFSHVRAISHNEIEIPIQTISNGTYVSIEENESEISSIVYPNPMHQQSKIIFSNPNHETWMLSLEDVTGRIAQPEISTTENLFLIEKKNLGNGIYFYRIRNKEGRSGKGKIVIE